VQADGVAEIAAELYSLVPAQFTAARDERARQAKADGQPELAAAVRKLARPTASAWLVNQLVRAEPGQLSRLFEVAEALQDAQRELAGDRLRELSGQRRQVIGELLTAANAVAAAAGQQLSPAALGEVRATLQAAIADPEAAAAVRSGQLTRALAYAGLGEVDLAAAMAAPRPAGKPAATRGGAAASKPPSGAGRAEAAAQALQAAEAAEQEAATTAEAAEHAVATFAEQRLFLRRRIEHLRGEMRQADTEDARLARDEAKAKRGQDAAARALTAARRRLAQARERAGAG
jgi:hypothetical protein